MRTTAVLPESNDYWNILKDVSDEVKLDLIARLSNSLLHPKVKKKVRSASSFYGVWKDTDFMDVDNLIKEISKSRRFKDDIEAF